MSKAFSAFYDHLLPELPGCTTALVDLHLLQVARDFCNRTSAWRDTFPSITAAPATLSYFLVTAASKSELVKPSKLTINSVLTWCAVDPDENDDAPISSADDPPFVVNADGDQITFDDQPSGAIVLEGSMRPALNSTTLPDFLLNDQLEAMRAGVLSRLMAMGKKHWTDRDGAAFYAGEYARRTNFAASKAAGGNTRRPLRVRKWG